MRRITNIVGMAALLGIGASSIAAETLQSGSVPQHAVVADFNGDGRMDIAVANSFDDNVSIHLQEAGGGYASSVDYEVGISPFHPSNFPRYLEVTDVNGDGAADLLVLCSGSSLFGTPPSLQTLLNLGSGALVPLEAAEVGTAPESDEFSLHFVRGHFGGDALEDVAVANSRSQSISILIGDGTGQFTQSQVLPAAAGASGPRDLVVTDADMDGLDEIWAATSEGLLFIAQASPGVFGAAQQVSLPTASTALSSVLADDLNGDGNLDLAVGSVSEVVVLESITGSGSYADWRSLTDASLDDTSDLAAVNRDGDPVPDLAVTNLGSDTVTVFNSGGGIDVLNTGGEPRRITFGDLNSDGRMDLLTANEADQGNPGNVDLNILLSPSINGEITATSEGVEDPGADIGLRLAHPLDASIANNGRLWLVESGRMAIQEFNPGPNLNLNPAATVGSRLEFGFEIGGIQMTSPTNGWIIQRWGPLVQRFRTNDGAIQETVSLAVTPGAQGFAGLAIDENDNFYLSDPHLRKVHVLDSSGAIVREFPVPAPLYSLVWNEDTDRLYGVNPGRSDVYAFDEFGTLDAGESFVVGSSSDYLARFGFSGITIDSGEWTFMGNNGLIVRADSLHSVTQTGSVSVAVDTVALALDTEGVEISRLYAIDRNGQTLRSNSVGFDNSRLFSFLEATDSDPSFSPSGVAFDLAAGEYVVSDINRPVVARFSKNGDLIGMEDHSAALVGHQVTGGVAFDPVSSTLWFRTKYGVITSTGTNFQPVPQSGSADIAIYDDLILVGLSNPSEMLLLDIGAGTRSLIVLPPGQRHGGLAFIDEQTLVNLGSGRSSGVETISLHPGSSVSAWTQY